MQQYLNLIFNKHFYKEVITIDDDTLIKLSYVNIISYRAKTVKSLRGEVKIPTKIAKDTGILPNHISKVLKELKDAGIAECINEEAKKGRYTDLLFLEKILLNIWIILTNNIKCLEKDIVII